MSLCEAAGNDFMWMALFALGLYVSLLDILLHYLHYKESQFILFWLFPSYNPVCSCQALTLLWSKSSRLLSYRTQCFWHSTWASRASLRWHLLCCWKRAEYETPASIVKITSMHFSDVCWMKDWFGPNIKQVENHPFYLFCLEVPKYLRKVTFSSSLSISHLC